MQQELKRMTLSASFWETGYRENLDLDAQGRLILKDRTKRGYFFGRALDLADEEMTYQRVYAKGNLSPHTHFRMGLLASDGKELVLAGKLVDRDPFFLDPHVSAEEKLALFQDSDGFYGHTGSDFLLHSLKGRYLWICFSLFDMSDQPVSLQEMGLEFPQQSFVAYLPEVYQEESGFLKRYLGIFQSLYLDMERNIDRLPLLLDPDTVFPDRLSDLAAWLGVENPGEILSQDQFRYLVKHALRLNRRKGTVRSIREMVKLYTGREPYLVEYFQLKPFMEKGKEREALYGRLYTDNPYTFCILLEEGELIKGGGQVEALSQLIEQVRPAHTAARILVLEKSARLDFHSYLGINSVLEKRSGAVVGSDRKLTGSLYLSR